jgi:Carboxypeptidase regulatory-like domain
MKLLLRLVAIVVIVSCLVLKAGAQTSSGQISGKIVDPAGASIANAPVRLTNQLTGEVREAKTVSSGEFVFAGVQPGTFSISVSARGFKTFEEHDLRLSVQRPNAMILDTPSQSSS